jgi:flagellar biosynthesis protein FlhG
MIDAREDQAAGLRRLFRKAPPAVVAVYATGHRADASVVGLAQRLAGNGQPVLVLDENPQGACAASSGLDLLHALDGRISLAELRQSLGGAVTRVPIAVAAATFALLDESRRQRLLALLEELHRRAVFVLVRAGEVRRPTPFTWAAPRRLMVAEASGRGACEAYAMIKDLAAAGVGSLHVAVSRARGRDDAARFFMELEALVRRHVGISLAWLGEVERDDLAASLAVAASPASPRESERAFLRRLQVWGRDSGVAGRAG